MKKLYTLISALLLVVLSSSAHPAAMSTYLENKLIDHLFRAQTYTPPSVVCVALVTALPSAGSTGSSLAEPGDSHYARGQLNPSASAWFGTGGETSGASSGASGMTSNNGTITFGTSATSGYTVTGFVIVDSCTIHSGNVLFYAVLNNPKTVVSGDPVLSFGVQALAIQMR